MVRHRVQTQVHIAGRTTGGADTGGGDGGSVSSRGHSVGGHTRQLSTDRPMVGGSVGLGSGLSLMLPNMLTTPQPSKYISGHPSATGRQGQVCIVGGQVYSVYLLCIVFMVYIVYIVYILCRVELS